MNCNECGWPLREVFWDESVTPNIPLCEPCHDRMVCDCGQRAIENGLCVDCLDYAESMKN